MVRQRSAKPLTGVRFSSWPPTRLMLNEELRMKSGGVTEQFGI